MKKNILTLTPATKKLWSKKTKERTNADYILIAELPNQTKPLYASTVGGNLEKRFGHNFNSKLQEITISEKKSDKTRYLKLMLTEDKHYELQQEEFALLVSCMNTTDTGKTHMDNLLYFRNPKLIGSSEIKQCYFPSDTKEQAALALFLLSATFIGGGND